MMRHAVLALAALVAAASLHLVVSSAALAADGAAIVEKRCAACHGRNGASTDPAIPIIGGYSATYIRESLRNFKTKIRPCAEVTVPSGPAKGTRSDMCKVTAELGDDEAEAVSRFLSTQKFVRARQAFDAGKAQKGKAIYKLRCEKCHENGGSSPAEDNGILAGQWTPYLKAQLSAFRAGNRPIDDKMKQRLDRVNPEEQEALLHFFASQQ